MLELGSGRAQGGSTPPVPAQVTPALGAAWSHFGEPGCPIFWDEDMGTLLTSAALGCWFLRLLPH